MVLLGLLCLALGQSSPEAPEGDSRARELYENGVILYNEGRYEDAVVAWDEAYRLSGRPLLLFNMANAEERLGRYQEALDHLNRYRAFASEDERETLDRRITNLERRLAETTPATLPAVPPPTTTAPPPEEDNGRFPVVPVVLFGVGGLGLGTGTIAGVTALGARSDARALCVDAASGLYCPTDASAALQKDKTASLIADIGWVVGVLGVAGGVVTVAVPLDGGGALQSTLSLGPSGLLWGGRF